MAENEAGGLQRPLQTFPKQSGGPGGRSEGSSDLCRVEKGGKIRSEGLPPAGDKITSDKWNERLEGV